MPALLFYNDWPLGYHNREAQRKAVAFAHAGYQVFYVAGIGVRNPRPSRAERALDLFVRAVRDRGRRQRPADLAPGVSRLGLMVLPPRQVGPIRRLNERWVATRIRAALPDPSDVCAWIRFATPEVVGALPRFRPRAIIYEVTDAHWRSPQFVGRWRERFERAERELVALADLVVVTNRSLIPRYELMGARISHQPHGVDLADWSGREPRRSDEPVLGFLGTLDYRLDPAIVRAVAEARPSWRIRLIGPVERGFEPALVAGLANVTIEPPVAHDRIAEMLREFDVAFMPYAVTPIYEHGFPLKVLEALAVGLPVVVRPNLNVEDLGSLVYCAREPQDFLREIERALAEDTPKLASERRSLAESRSWDGRLEELVGLAAGVMSAGDQSISSS